MTPIGCPAWPLVASDIARQLHELAGDNFHYIKVVISVRAPPTERQQLAVGGPCRIDHITHVGQIDFSMARTIRVHGVELRNAAAIADEGDLLARFRIPRWRCICPVRISESLWPLARSIRDEELRISKHARHEHELRTIG